MRKDEEKWRGVSGGREAACSGVVDGKRLDMCDAFFVGQLCENFQAQVPVFFPGDKISSKATDQKGGANEVPAAGAFTRAHSSCEKRFRRI